MKETHLTCTDSCSKQVSGYMVPIRNNHWCPSGFLLMRDNNKYIISLFAQELFQHHYPEISCVGRFGQPDYTVFAFCVA